MKKILALAIVLMTVSLASFGQSTTPRFGTTASSDNTYRVLSLSWATPAYADTIKCKPTAYKNIIKPASLTGNSIVTATVTSSYAGDEMVLMLYGTGSRTLTFSTGFVVSASTLVVDSLQKATISFICDGVAWIETSRAKE